ncbi:restriction endonuclease subunit S [Nanchangia anserum]|uniref:Restriction endonuclease subunit S n=1 Tax=Nanchangia anserum TaxID=2692125 RepID=A0A8I0KU74_9ACTO|nr:restriction endonuclease subunit S [Nanchangia anserum]MBD3689393.1 restriction endonuclease subunit S [Nanchangia anserum]QOX81600.1 restriction endonuclease subunit S [Nanchangia anserum]
MTDLRDLHTKSVVSTFVNEFPNEWEITALRNICHLHTGSTPPKTEARYWGDGFNWFSSKDLKSLKISRSLDQVTGDAVKECGLSLHQPGTLVACFRSGILRHTFPVALATEPFTINQDLRALSLDNRRLAEYILYYLTGMNDHVLRSCLKVGATVESVETKWFLDFPVPIPPQKEQDDIVKYLDSKTAEIDGLVSKLERERELLERYRRELIAHTVTRGLNPGAPTRDSGIEWIGKIPSAWREDSLKSMLRRISIRNKPERRVLSVERVNGVVDRETEGSPDNHNRLPDDLSRYLAVDRGQFVMNKMKAWRGSYGVSRLDGIVSPAYYVFALNHPNPDFFNWAIRSDAYVPFFGRDSYGIRTDQWDFKLSTLSSMPFFSPPIDEQQEIANYLDEKTSDIDSTVAGINRQIELLGRYRKQVINDAVTGKIRVGEVA